jgi:phage tail sheath gpL-like
MSGSIQSGTLYPLTQIAFDNSQAGVNQVVKPTLLIGQTVIAQPLQIMAVTSLSGARAAFGRGSSLARIYEAYFTNDTTGPIYCLPFADAVGSTKATGTFTITGPATANGTIFAYIGGRLVTSGVTSGQIATLMATNLAAAINANPDVAVVATSAAAVVTCTAKNGGTLGNGIALTLNYQGAVGGQSLPAGVAVAVVGMAGGATDPDMTQVAPILGDKPMFAMIHPYTLPTPMGAFAAMMNFATGRWSPTRKSWGHCMTARADTPAGHVTYSAGNNDPHSSVYGYELGSPTPADEAAAAYWGTAIPSYRAQPNLPVQTLQMQFFLPPPSGLSEASGGSFSKTTWQLLLGSGISLATVAAGNVPVLLRAPTTYQTNAFGQADQSYFDTGSLYTLMAIAQMLDAMETQKWGRVLLADNGTNIGPNIPFKTPATAKADIYGLYLDMVSLGLVEDPDAMLAATTVSRNLQVPTELDTTFAPFLVLGLIQANTTIQFRNYSAAAAAAILGQ